MVGRSCPPLPADRPAPPRTASPAPGASSRPHRQGRPRPRRPARTSTFTVEAGELVGVAGVSGNGQRSCYEAVLGLRALGGGSVTHRRHAAAAGPTPRRVIEAGAVGVPGGSGDRRGRARAVVLEHLSLGGDTAADARACGIDWKTRPAPRPATSRRPRRSTWPRSTARSPRCRAATSSGSLYTRARRRRRRAARGRLPEPGPRHRHRPRRPGAAARAAGRRAAACCSISEDLDELFELSDRIVVLHDGEVAGDRRSHRDRPPRDRSA